LAQAAQQVQMDHMVHQLDLATLLPQAAQVEAMVQDLQALAEAAAVGLKEQILLAAQAVIYFLALVVSGVMVVVQ
jgi:hypothetical protein